MNGHEALLLRRDAAEQYLGELVNRLWELETKDPVYFSDRDKINPIFKYEIDLSHWCATGDGLANIVLSNLLDALDEMDEDDFFGTQGWRYRVMGEDV